ncbi:molybdenum cofactor biosynthesis protein A [Planctomycetes bacterium Poly30]|uniref:Molybdenum cofactor biosynthesis protein A n=1 Tax=Saltatorellus ferox TaxID=2528018 RepID=A0A518ENP3_9BACT|nr:molybdenum cofactor biosynthesis protein A [Planctomycetes bacterium Poly30]
MKHAIHNFSAKLRQPSVAPTLQAYIDWRRAVRAAREHGAEEPAMPEIAPVSINLDLTTACNYRCTHCIDWDILNTKHKLAEEDLRTSIALMRERGLKSVILIGGGEPTLYPGFVGFTKFLKELGLKVSIVTNGSRGDRLAEVIGDFDDKDWIRMSLDSGSNELFREMHKPTSSAVTLDVICEWVPKLKAINPAPQVGFSYIIVWSGASREEHALNENIHEIVMAAERAKAAQFDYIAFKPILERQEDGAEVMNPAKAEAREREVVAEIRRQVDLAKELGDGTFKVFESTNLRMLEDGSWRESTRQPKTCHMQALRQVLTPTGVYNCPAHRGVDKAVVGPKEAYAGEARAAETGQSVAALLDRFDASHECRNVTCLYHDVNWWIEGLVEGEDGKVEEAEETGDFFL